MHAAAEVPSVETLRRFKIPPLSSSDMRIHLLMPPGMTPHQAAQRTAQRTAQRYTGPVAPPTPFLQDGLVPMMLKLDSSHIEMNMPTHANNKGTVLLECLGSDKAYRITDKCALGFFPL